MEGRNIAEAGEPDGARQAQSVEQMNGAVAAATADNGFDGGVIDGGLQVGEAVGGRGGEGAAATFGSGHYEGHKAGGGNRRGGAVVGMAPLSQSSDRRCSFQTVQSYEHRGR